MFVDQEPRDPPAEIVELGIGPAPVIVDDGQRARRTAFQQLCRGVQPLGILKVGQVEAEFRNQFRRRGIGGALLGRIVETAKTLDVQVGFLEVRSGNQAAVSSRACCEHVDAWETKYIHLLPVVAGGRHPVLEWLSGTAMRPIRKALSDVEWEEFSSEYEIALTRRYTGNAVVVFAFRRVFAVAYRRA